MRNKTLHQLYAEHTGKVSDKWSLYLSEYDRLFDSYRDKPVRMLEIGIQNGGSLEIWGQYFAKAEKLIGCDINPDCHNLTYNDSRIVALVGDANLDETEKLILSHSPTYDLIIDDGSHRSSDIIKSFVRYFPRLTDGGLFIAEDLHCSYWREFEGGLNYPYSSIAFFKKMADVVNREFWGESDSLKVLFSGFDRQYSVSFDEELFSQIRSVEFINSMCVVRKSISSSNILGPRVIAGSEEIVVKGHRELHGSVLEKVEPRPARLKNKLKSWIISLGQLHK